MNPIISEARRLWHLCFPTDTAEFLDFYFSKVAKAEDTYLDYDSKTGKAIAHIGILRYTYLPDRYSPPLRLAYISGACTDGEYRKQGLMSRLMNRVIREEQAKGTDALILIPADEDLRIYYNKHFGFINTAPRYTLRGQEVLLASANLAVASPSASEAELLCTYANSRQAIQYTKEQAQTIIEEYRLASGERIHKANQPQANGFLSLSRTEGNMLYIDRLIGNKEECHNYLEECLSIYEGVELSNLFSSDINESITQIPEPQPWGMALGISERGKHSDWSTLAISLVHN